MSKTFKRTLSLVFVGAAVLPGLAQAQAVSASKMMSKDELRACMKMQDQIKAVSASLEERKNSLAADKAKVSQVNEEVKTARIEIDAYAAAVKAADNAVREHAQKIEQWQVDLKEAESSPMKSAERRKKQLMGERDELDQRNKDLVAERAAKHKLYEAAVAAFNERAKGVDALVSGWNKNNEKLADDGDKLVDLRADYAADCANRRFKEDDEIAIKKELGR